LRRILAVTAGVLLAGTNAASAQRADSVSVKQLVARLRTAHGQFVDDAGVGFSLIPGSPADQAIVDSLVALDGAAIPLLVECLGDTTVSLIEYHEPLIGRDTVFRAAYSTPVSQGAVCFWPLIGTRWFQARMRRRAFSEEFMTQIGVSFHRLDAPAQIRTREAWRAYLRGAVR
jgi:hypothetical protein